MRQAIDADTHIAESPSMWNLIDPSMYSRRPVMVSAPEDTLYRDFNVLWLVDGKIFPKASGKGGFRIITPAASKREAGRTDIGVGCREITDVPARLADMDKAGVAVQVIYPTLFLIHITDDVELQTALCGAYNQYLEVYGFEPCSPNNCIAFRGPSIKTANSLVALDLTTSSSSSSVRWRKPRASLILAASFSIRATIRRCSGSEGRGIRSPRTALDGFDFSRLFRAISHRTDPRRSASL